MGPGGLILADEIKVHKSLQVFDISFNQICSNGKTEIIPEFRDLEKARERVEYEMLVLEAKQAKKPELMPKKKKETFWPRMFAERWRECFRENQSLVHVDFGFCGVQTQDTEIITEGLKENHTIYGFHFMGNQGYIDNLGFLVASAEESKADSSLPIKIGPNLESGKITDP
jgi:hypothetical protein